jgi:uncharacterized protein
MMSVLQAIDRAARLGMLAVALISFSPFAHAQQHHPTAAAMMTAKEIIAITGSTSLFNPVIAGVVEQAKGLFLQQNPGLAKDINEVAANLRAQLQPRFVEITNDVAREYATRFTDKELTELLAFYKSPVGKKLIVQQPLIADASLKFAQDWANKLSEEVINKMRAEMKKRGHDL